MPDDDKTQDVVAEYTRRLDAGEPLFTHVLSTPLTMRSEGGALVIDAANANIVGVGNKATVVRLIIPGGIALQLRDLLNQSTFTGSQAPEAKHQAHLRCGESATPVDSFASRREYARWLQRSPLFKY